MISFSRLSNERGVAIVAVALVMVVGAILGAAVVSQTAQDIQLAERAYIDKQELYLAESAKERAYREIMNDDTFANNGSITGVTLGGGTYDIAAQTLSASPFVVQIDATGDMSGSDKRRRITVIAEVIRENVCVWNNAVFGGSGQTGGVINGNCAIHGSVHLLGENVGDGNNSIAALDLNGTALVHNNYDGVPAQILAKVPELPTTVFGGETVHTIEAKLRVKNGAVGVSGDSEIGQPNESGNEWKETMDGIYIETDHSETRWTGNQVTDGVPDPAHVQSDNGTDALYDLGDTVQMPDLQDSVESDCSGITYSNYDAFFTAEGLTLPFSLTLDDSNSAAEQISGQQAALEASGMTVTVNGDAFSLSRTNACGVTNTIAYDPSVSNGQAKLNINGMVQVQGNLVVGEKNLDITYSGRGTIYSSGNSNEGTQGDVDMHSNFLPETTFPTVDVIGLVAKHDMNLATGPGDAQLSMAGAFFGQNQVVSRKQNEIAGTFVCNYFDMGTNVPSIYQVPSLVSNLPPGMIGSDPIWAVTGFDERSWRVDLID